MFLEVIRDMEKILIVEDEANMASFIELELKYEGYTVDIAHNGRLGLELALKNNYDVILLDLMLPGINGLEVCRRLLQVKYTPIIMLSARDSVMDKVTGLQVGAEDYLSKPFAIEELLARIQVIIRRNKKNRVSQYLRIKDIEVNLESREVLVNNKRVDLTNKEFELLVLLIKNVNKVLSRDIILDNVWGYESEVETNVVDVYIRYLRNKIDSTRKEEYIQTVRGTGYIMRE